MVGVIATPEAREAAGVMGYVVMVAVLLAMFLLIGCGIMFILKDRAPDFVKIGVFLSVGVAGILIGSAILILIGNCILIKREFEVQFLRQMMVPVMMLVAGIGFVREGMIRLKERAKRKKSRTKLRQA